MATEIQYPNVLTRYARDSVAIWAPRNTIIALRTIWVSALEIMRDLGEDIPAEAIEAYRNNIENIDLNRIEEIEKAKRHDVLANIAAFNEVAGYEYIHRGFTSRDPTDQKEQMQILQSLKLVRDRNVAFLARLQRRALEFMTLDITGRSHLVPAQTTTLGKRFANIAEEVLQVFDDLEFFIDHYAIRGVKGPMGTQQDMLALLKDPMKVKKFEERLARRLGFTRMLGSVGQVYPRSLDYSAATLVAAAASGPANLAQMVRLSAGLELMHEGFGEEQRGSSAMPHKVNSRSSERITGLSVVIGGYVEMLSGLRGNQWLEGDVSCSVVRRIALPDVFMAFDGLAEAALTVLDEMEVFPGAVQRELDRYLPLLSTTAFLTAAVKSGMGREKAHTVIRKHALVAVDALRRGKPPQLIEDLDADSEFPLDKTSLEIIVSKPDHGLAQQQVIEVSDRIQMIINRYPDAAAYNPYPLL